MICSSCIFLYRSLLKALRLWTQFAYRLIIVHSMQSSLFMCGSYNGAISNSYYVQSDGFVGDLEEIQKEVMV